MQDFRKHKSTSNSYCHISIIPHQYACTLELVDEMLEVAKTDFPFITKKDIQIVQQGGDYCKKMYALEFDVPSDVQMPSEYIEAKINPTL